MTKAVTLGDLSKQIEVDARGEILDLKNTVNGMVARFVAILFFFRTGTDCLVRLQALAAEVTRVTLEVGSQGKLGGQAHVPDVEGVWFELVQNVSICRTNVCMRVFMKFIGQSNVFLFYGSSAIDCSCHDRHSSG